MDRKKAVDSCILKIKNNINQANAEEEGLDPPPRNVEAIYVNDNEFDDVPFEAADLQFDQIQAPKVSARYA